MSRIGQEINSVNTELMSMGAMVVQQTELAVKALLSSDSVLARKVIAADRAIDDYENHINDKTIRILATCQPVAGDLRFFSVVFGLVTDLERVADLAVNLAWRTVAVTEEISLSHTFSPLLAAMAEQVVQMLHRVMDALARRDEQCAREVCASDNDLDSLHRAHRKAMLELMQAKPQLVPWGLEAILAGNYLERMGDHITNLGEEVVFLASGQVLRHCND